MARAIERDFGAFNARTAFTCILFFALHAMSTTQIFSVFVMKILYCLGIAFVGWVLIVYSKDLLGPNKFRKWWLLSPASLGHLEILIVIAFLALFSICCLPISYFWIRVIDLSVILGSIGVLYSAYFGRIRSIDSDLKLLIDMQEERSGILLLRDDQRFKLSQLASNLHDFELAHDLSVVTQEN